MAKSIIQDKRECLVCGTINDLELHHIFYGTANRKKSTEFGTTCYLCRRHHTGGAGVHFNNAMDDKLKKYAQERFEAVYGENTSFIEVFGRNYK